jgi:predicted AAA+ superfamily ATPase
VYPRYATARVDAALADTRVVYIGGPRQSGKTTLARALSGASRPFFTLDDEATRQAARSDPTGFLRGLDQAAIDEVQRAPDLLLAIKRSVDLDPRPGRFLLTGSADLMTLPTVADSLAGRMEVVPLLPLAQAEIEGTPTGFLDAAFAGRFRAGGTSTVRGESLTARILTGGYPEALQRAAPERRRRWHREYLHALLRRDVADIAALDRLSDLPRLVERLAVANGQLVNFAAFGTDLAMDRKTAQRYVDVLVSMYLVELLPAWHTNALSRLTKSAKLHFTDSGLAATLAGLTLERARRDRTALGAVFETFVYGELRKQASFRESPVAFHHFRGRETEEVDLVLEDPEGRLVGIEVKASATATAADFRGLRILQQAAGPRFAAGLLLHDGEQVIPFGERLWAMPIERLWTEPGRQ